MRRGFWFAAGAASGVYVLARARRTAESLTPDGLKDRLAGLSLGVQVFGDEVRTEMRIREAELRGRLRLEWSEPVRALGPADSEMSAENMGAR